jgi:hypothetical protein
VSPATRTESFTKALVGQLRALVDSTTLSKAAIDAKLTAAERGNVKAAVEAAREALGGEDAERLARCLQAMVRADEILRKANVRP